MFSGLKHEIGRLALPARDLATQFLCVLELGNGLSTHLPEKLGDESFWNESIFHAELLNLISKLNLQTYDLIGHSWGGMISASFASKQPKGLRKLVLSNSPARAQDFVDSYNNYRKGMPQEVQDTLQKHEDAGTTESKEYEEMMMLFYEKHMMRIIPFPEDFQTSFGWAEKDKTVVLTM
jgi:L-proline amide hydrolase